MGSMNFGLYPDAGALQGLQARLGAALSRRLARPHLQEHLRRHRAHPDAPAPTTARASRSSATTSAISTRSPISSTAAWSSRRSSSRACSASSAASAPHPEDVMHMRRTADRLFGEDYHWSVLGAGRNQMTIAAQSVAHGRQCARRARGLAVARPGPARRAATPSRSPRRVRLIEELGLEVATPDEAREILALRAATGWRFERGQRRANASRSSQAPPASSAPRCSRGLLADPAVAQVHTLGRRPPPVSHAKLTAQQVDFAALPPLPAADEVYLALGTTIKVAGEPRRLPRRRPRRQSRGRRGGAGGRRDSARVSSARWGRMRSRACSTAA